MVSHCMPYSHRIGIDTQNTCMPEGLQIYFAAPSYLAFLAFPSMASEAEPRSVFILAVVANRHPR